MSKASKNTTKPVDVALMRDAKAMVLCIERDAASYRFATELKAPLDKAISEFKRKYSPSGSISAPLYEKMEAIRSRWGMSAAGRNWRAAWDEYQTAATLSRRACTRVIRHKPKSLAGAAYIALASMQRDGCASQMRGYDNDETVRIVLMLFQAAGLRAPPAVRRILKRHPALAALLRRYGC